MLLKSLFFPVLTLACLLRPLSAQDVPAVVDDETKTSVSAQAVTRSETFQANDDWSAINFQPAKIVKGSALDFSGFLDAPAGKHGEVISRDGYFVFKDAPEQPVRFYGTTISHGLPFLDKPHAEQLADYLAACGFNIVRFHSYTFPDGVMKDKGSAEFNPGPLDQWDYLLSCMKQRGIYYTFPLNVGNFFKAGDITDVEEFKNRDFRFEICGLLPISQDAQMWFKRYSKNLLCHTNPYTGIAMKDDPALVSVEVDNENGIFKTFGAMPEFVEIYRKKCRQYLAEKNGKEPTANEVEKALPAYALDLQEKFYAMMRDYLRSIGVKKPLTDISNRINMAYAIPRSEFDYFDSHNYWDLYKMLPGAKADGHGEGPYA